MAKRLVVAAALCAVSLLVAGAGAAEKPIVTDRTLVIEVHNYSRMTAAMIGRALEEAERLFRSLGISLRSVGRNTDAGAVPRFHVLVVDSEHPELQDRNTSLLGAAPRTGNKTGQLAYVFFKPIEALADAYAVDASLVLAHAIAHEVGHLLLPPGHTSDGLMCGKWGARQVRAAAAGSLTFSTAESNRIRGALRPDPGSLMVRR